MSSAAHVVFRNDHSCAFRYSNSSQPGRVSVRYNLCSSVQGRWNFIETECLFSVWFDEAGPPLSIKCLCKLTDGNLVEEYDESPTVVAYRLANENLVFFPLKRNLSLPT